MKKIRALLLVMTAFFSACGGGEGWKDASMDIDRRVENLLKEMTLEEKCAQLQNRFVNPGDPLSEALDGKSWGAVFSLMTDADQCRAFMDSIRRYVRDSTRLGIPVITCAEGIQGILMNGTTIFPHALAQGSTFNPKLIGRMAVACAREAGALGIDQVLSPVLELARDPRWGRVEETYGEDPLLVADMATAFVKGYQENGVGCTLKHFIAHGSPTGGINCAGVSGGERELRSLYLPPFQKVIDEADPVCVMSSYNAYDGVPVSGSKYYLTDLLRGEMGFKGYVYSDWGSVERLADYHFVAADLKEAAAMALEAGVDLNVMAAYYTLPDQVKEGKVDEKLVDKAVRRVLRAKFRLGLFDRVITDTPVGAGIVRSEEHISLSKEISDESAILLENNGILPLDTKKIRRIALLGPNSAQTVFGDYSWPDAFAPEGVNLLQGLQQRLPKGIILRQYDGCDWWSQDGSRIAEAARIAAASDVAIVAVGTRSTFLARKSLYNTSGEGNDLSSLDLPGRQMDLLKAVKATGTPLIVVLISGKPLAMPWVKDNADAFLVQWYGGEQQGLTLADILLGNVNPSGRLNVSFPRSTGNIPCYYNYFPSDREYYGGHGGTYENPKERYVFEIPYAVWNFGDGKGYTTFGYRSCTLDRKEYSAGDTIKASVEVENTGDRDGKEVVQLYVRDLVSSVATPIMQLKAYEKVMVPAGKKVSVQLEVPVGELSLIDARMRRKVEPGQFEIQVGGASDRISFRDTILVR